MERKFAQDRLYPNTKGAVLEVKYREWLAESLSHIPSLNYQESNLEIPIVVADDAHRIKSPSTEMEHCEYRSDSDHSFDFFQPCLNEREIGEWEATRKKLPQLMLCPEVIRAPLRSIRADKRAELRA
jgi:hypothetical protein